MAVLRKAVAKKIDAITSQDEWIRAAMGKAIRGVRRNAEANDIKLAVAGKKSWAIPNS